MRITVIRNDSLVSIDGETIKGINLDQLDKTIHAIQWYGEDGEIERVNERGHIIANEKINSFVPYEWVIDAWQSVKDSTELLPEVLVP